MPQIINTNISSLNAQRNLNTSQSALATSLQRLSSGLRINSAKDDAAGMAISDRMTTQIRGLNQAARNANDAISLSQTAEGAMNTIGDNLQRIRELAVQSLNATNSVSDRNALDAEVQQLTAEIDRVAQQTTFNGVKLLDGTFSSQVFQVGANAGETISIDAISSLRTAALGSGLTSAVTGTATTGPLTASALTINGVAIGASVAGTVPLGQSTSSAWSIAKAINAVSGHNVTATANATSVSTGAPPGGFGAIAANAFQINGVNVGAVTAGTDAITQGTNVAAAVNLISASTGVSAAAAADGTVTLTSTSGADITVGGTVTNTGLAAATTHGTISLTSSGAAGITIAGGAGAAAAGLSVGATAASATGTSVATLNVKDITNSNAALASVDAALTTLNSARGAMGAYQNRFASTVANLATTSENVTAARSRIQDADFAAETAQLTRNQILQQAGTAMLSQANSLPQNVLSLLR